MYIIENKFYLIEFINILKQGAQDALLVIILNACSARATRIHRLARTQTCNTERIVER